MTRSIHENRSNSSDGKVCNTVQEMASKTIFIGIPTDLDDKEGVIQQLRRQLLESNRQQEKSKEEMASLRLQLLNSRDENKRLMAKCEQNEARINKLYDLASKHANKDNSLLTNTLKNEAAIQDAAHIRILQKQTALANMNVTYH
ncbi:BZRAP1 [Acrasis kona]|uniref:BZRAP1 n=1 Tax=Acrasis kona TaxID=1008807 RepID=A0AAW2Z5D9_9EUKA